MPPSATLIPDALAFFDDLRANNTRDWFQAHKADYEAQVKTPAEMLLREIGRWLEHDTGQAQASKLYRIHRDLRFSKDKTPYNTHLHLQWSDPTTGVSHLFGISRDYVCAGVGVMAFAKPALDTWRARIASDAGDTLAQEIDICLADGHRLDAPALKRVPAPFDQDHPRADHLKRKGLVLWHDFTDAERTAPKAALQSRFTRLSGFRRRLGDLLTP